MPIFICFLMEILKISGYLIQFKFMTSFSYRKPCLITNLHVNIHVREVDYYENM